MGVEMELNSHRALAAILTVTTIVAARNLTRFIKRTALLSCATVLSFVHFFVPTADAYKRVITNREANER